MDPSILLFGLLLAMLLFTMQRGSKQRREIAQVQASIGPGAEVMMASGLYATVVSVDGDRVTVTTSPGQTSVWDRRAVAKILRPADAGETSERADPDDTNSEPSTGNSEPGSPPEARH